MWYYTNYIQIFEPPFFPLRLYNMLEIARRHLCGGILTLLCVLAATLPLTAGAQVSAAKPYDQVVSEVVVFLVSDVGRNGILTNDDDPAGYPVPPYFYSYAINDGNNLDGNLSGYPGYLSVSYPAYTAAVAIARSKRVPSAASASRAGVIGFSDSYP